MGFLKPQAQTSGNKPTTREDSRGSGGENKNADLLKDPAMLKRMQDIQSLPQEDKTGVLYALDNLLKAAILKTI